MSCSPFLNQRHQQKEEEEEEEEEGRVATTITNAEKEGTQEKMDGLIADVVLLLLLDAQQESDSENPRGQRWELKWVGAGGGG